MFICLDTHEPLVIVDTKDGIVEKQSGLSMSNIMSKGYKVLGLLYKKNKLEIDRKYIGKNNAMEVINPHNGFKGAELVIIRNRDSGIIYGISCKNGKEAFRTTDKKFVEAKELDISYLSKGEQSYIITFKYDGKTDIVTYTDGKRENKLTINGDDRDNGISITRTIGAIPYATESFNESVAEAMLKKLKIKAKVIGDKDMSMIKGYLCSDDRDKYWVLKDGRIYKGDGESFKILYKPDSCNKADKEETVKRIRNLVIEYGKASAMGDKEAKGMEKALCEKLGIQRIVSLACGNGFADMIVVVNDVQQKVKLDFKTCKLQNA